MRSLMPTCTLCVLALSLVAGCESKLDATDGTRVDDPIPGDVQVPVVGVDAIVVNGSVEPDDHLVVGYAATRLFVVLGVGEGYPSQLTVDVGELWQSRCLLEGTWTASALKDGGDGVVDVRLEGNRLHLDVLRAGSTTVTVEGSYDGGCRWWSDAIGLWEMDLTYQIEVVEPVAAAFYQDPGPCTEGGSPLTVTGARLHSGFSVDAVDANGKTWRRLDNAEQHRQVAYAIELPAGMSTEGPSEETGLDGMIFEGEGGTVVFSSAAGAFAELEVVTPDAVTDIDVDFVIPMADAGRDLVLGEEPAVVWEDLYLFNDKRRVLPIAGTPLVGEREACAKPAPEWFAAEVSPSEPVSDEVPYTNTYGSMPVASGWEIVEDGAHTFRLQAPELNGGEGIEHEVAVTFR